MSKQLSTLAVLVIVLLSIIFFPQSQSVFEDFGILPTQNVTPTRSSDVLSSTTLSESATVTKVIDGDTIQVTDEDGKHTVRLIGVNTPETVDPRRKVECFGKEASNKAKELLMNKKVRLEEDLTQQNKDKYGRFLRYIFLPDGTHINKVLIQEGFAYEYTYEVPYQYQAEFKSAQNEAVELKKGLWSDTTCSGKK